MFPVKELVAGDLSTQLPFDFSRTAVMGILNVTPDSFSDGGKYTRLTSAMDHAMQMMKAGADIIDVGGESTRPGAEPLGVAEELDRVIPVIEEIKARCDCMISVDTSSPEVMQAAVETGAAMINDVRALRRGNALEVACRLDVPVCLMHMQGSPETMQMNPVYDNLMEDICDFFEERINACEAGGMKRSKIIIDPGFGFGKTVDHNMQLLRELTEFGRFGLPIMIGLSRKSTLGHITGKDPEERLASSVAGAVVAALNGAHIIRVHDVAETVDAMKMVEALGQNISKSLEK